MLLSNLFLFNEITETEIEKLDKKQIELLSDWIENGASKTISALAKYHREQIQDIVEYIKDLPVYDIISIKENKYFLSHSGVANFEKQKSLEQYQISDFLWNRPCINDIYFDDMISVFGHTPTCFFGKEYQGKFFKNKQLD